MTLLDHYSLQAVKDQEKKDIPGLYAVIKNGQTAACAMAMASYMVPHQTPLGPPQMTIRKEFCNTGCPKCNLFLKEAEEGKDGAEIIILEISCCGTVMSMPVELPQEKVPEQKSMFSV